MSSGSESAQSSSAGEAPPAPPLLQSISENESEDDSDREVSRTVGSNLGQSRTLISGYLMKKGERRKAWKRRWFVLRADHLAMYKNDKEYKLLKCVQMRDVHSCAPVAMERHGHAFGIVTPARTYFIQARDAAEMWQWVNAIGGLISGDATAVAVSPGAAASGTAAGPAGISSPINVVSPRGVRSPSLQPLASPSTGPPPTISLSISPGSSNALSSSYSSTSTHLRSPNPNDTSSSSEDEDDTPQLLPDSASATTVRATPQKTILKQATVPNKVILQAYLLKQGTRKSWRKRWFTLSNTGLTYSSSHTDQSRKRHIPLSSIMDAIDVDGDTQHMFKIITPKRTYLISAPSEDEEIKWLAAFQFLLKNK